MFYRLKVFYKEAIPYEGWNQYDEINLKYKKQIVCNKNYDLVYVDGGHDYETVVSDILLMKEITENNSNTSNNFNNNYSNNQKNNSINFVKKMIITENFLRCIITDMYFFCEVFSMNYDLS